jgi:hypothetical protein
MDDASFFYAALELEVENAPYHEDEWFGISTALILKHDTRGLVLYP